MSDGDNRHITRDSLFILAEMRLDGSDTEYRVKVRNLSPGGMMGEGDAIVARGDSISINLRSVGWIDGLIAWVQGNRFGVSFAKDVDVKLVRAPLAKADPDEQFRRKLLTGVQQVPTGPIRKVF